MAAARGRVGRPRALEKEAPRQYVGFPVPVSVKTQLEAAAAANGRSISAEGAIRLARSFEAADLLNDALRMRYGPQGSRLLSLMGQLMIAAVINSGKMMEADWLSDDPNPYAAVKAALVRLLDKFPAAPGEPGAGVIEVAERRADELLWNMSTVDDMGYGSWGALVRADLGDATAKRMIEKCEADRAALLAGPPREQPQPDPADLEMWVRSFDLAHDPAFRPATGPRSERDES